MDWMKYDVRSTDKNQPPEGVLVEVCGSDYLGDWTSTAIRKNYKPNHKGKKKWRWMDMTGEDVFPDTVSKWRLKDGSNNGSYLLPVHWRRL